MINNRSYIRASTAGLISAILVIAFTILAGPQALAADRGLNSATYRTPAAHRDFKPVPRSPGVVGLTDAGAVKHACPVHSFADDEPGSQPTVFSGGTLEGQDGTVLVVGESWATWNPQTNGLHLLFAPAGSYTLQFSSPVKAVVLKAEPNDFGEFPITVTGYDTQGRPLGSYTRNVAGYFGAAYLGLASQSRPIRSITISAPAEAGGFAFSEITWGPNSCGGPQH